MQNNLILPDIAVLQSINPPHCENIASLRKSIEVRKTRPKLETPFKSYIYCTNNRAKEGGGVTKANGKVIGEYVCDEIVEFTADEYSDRSYYISDDELAETCLSQEELWEYGKGKTLYGYHISNLVIYSKPKELSEFKKVNRDCFYSDLGLAIPNCDKCKEPTCFIQRPPQSWCYVQRIN